MTLGAAALLGGCGGQIEDDPPGNPPAQHVDGGPGDAMADAPQFCDTCNPPPPAPVCPSEPPTEDTECNFVNGVMCTWGGSCDEIDAVCLNGQWKFASVNPPAPVCPLTPPSVGEDCSALCLPPDYGCAFPTGECPFGDSGSWTGVCSGGVWTSVGTTCVGPTISDGGPVDAGGWPDSGL